MDWNDQIAHARKLVSQAIGALYSIKHNVPQKILRTVYFSLVQPYFIYAMPIWATNHNSAEFQMLFKLQKKAIRIISNKTSKIDGIFQHTKPIFKSLNILTIHNLYLYMTACTAKKVLCSGMPRIIFNLYEPSLRSSRLELPKFKKEKIKLNSFIFNSSKILNYLTANKVSYKNLSLDTFKINLKRLLMTRQNISLRNDPNWLPLNYSFFSGIEAPH